MLLFVVYAIIPRGLGLFACFVCASCWASYSDILIGLDANYLLSIACVYCRRSHMTCDDGNEDVPSVCSFHALPAVQQVELLTNLLLVNERLFQDQILTFEK
jgi:hypothetical protein